MAFVPRIQTHIRHSDQMLNKKWEARKWETVLKEALAIPGRDGHPENHPPEGNAVKGTQDEQGDPGELRTETVLGKKNPLVQISKAPRTELACIRNNRVMVNGFSQHRNMRQHTYVLHMHSF